MNRKRCRDCMYRTHKDGKWYCPRHKHWLQEGTMQITLHDGSLCDWLDKPNMERGKDEPTD